MTITLASLATSTTDVGRQSTAVDNTSVDGLDFIVGGKITTGTSPTVNKQIEIWFTGSYDGTSYSGGAGASDAGFTPVGTKNLMHLGQIINVTATSNVTYTWIVPSLAAVFGGIVPSKWAVFVTQNTGAALNATAGNHEMKYETYKVDSV
jgi:hypothetical protein